MTLRTKLTLWYVGVLFMSLMLCTLLLYREWVIEPRHERELRHAAREREEALERTGKAEPGNQKEREHQDEDDDETVENLARNVFWIAIPAAILGLGGGWWLMRKTMIPVTTLTRAAEQINENTLNMQLPLSGNGDELDRLTAVFNGMTARLNDSFRRIREFTLRASHELKTPLTIMRGSMETALNTQSLAPGQRDRLMDEIDEVDRLAKIVDGLTLLTKADAGLITLKREPVKLDLLLREIFTDGQVLARPGNITLQMDVCEETAITGDNDRLRQMLLNLVDNAVKYNQPGGLVTLMLKHAGKSAELAVSNTGPGVAAEMLDRLFDPFFRGDESHTRSVDGCGLGLSIVKWIAVAHGGSVTLTSQPQAVTTVTVLLPLGRNPVPDLKDENA
jgi:signal transduction histidine kinase